MDRMNPIQAHMEAALVTHVRWLVDDVSLREGKVAICGWIASLTDNFDKVKIWFCRTLSDDAALAPDQALGEHYPSLGKERFRRYVASAHQHNLSREEGCFRFSITSGSTPNARTYRTAWFYPVDQACISIPDGDRIRRVIGTPNSTSYLTGGSTIVRRFDLYLQERFAKPIARFDRVLDWGGGSARLTNHLLRLNANTWGADIDKDNIDWCNRNVRAGDGHFRHVSVNPPTPFGENEFELVVGVSVFTHLGEEDQFRWLAELARVMRPGGIALISIKGLSVFAMERTDPTVIEKLYVDHFVTTGVNHDLSGYIEDSTYYKNVLHSPDYVFSCWSRYFEIIDIIPGLALPQDLVVMRKSSP